MENNQVIVKGNRDKRILILTIVVVVQLVIIIILGMVIAKEEFKYCNDVVEDKVDDYIDKDIADNCMSQNYNEYDVDIEILSMNKPIIDSNNMNHHMYVTGKMMLNFKEENFQVVGLDGFCIGKDNEKYKIYGPEGVEVSFNNGDTEYYLTESFNDEDGDVIYPDGTIKSNADVDWETVRIKYCKIENLYTAYNKNGKTITSYTRLDYEKNFN